MDLQVKKYVYRDLDNDMIYLAKDLETLQDRFELAKRYCGVFAICEISGGPTLFEVDQSYLGEPIIMQRIMHWDSFKKFHNDHNFIEL